MAGRRYWNELKAAQVLSAWRRSGLSLAAYARREGEHVGRLRRWKRRLLGSGGCVEASPARRFLPVRIIDSIAGRDVIGVSFEVVLGEPVRVRVPADFDEAALSRLLGVLSGC